MATTISIECGPKLATKLTAHEELLCCCSRLFQQLHTKAKPLRDQYTNCDDLKDQLARCVFPEVTAKQFENDHMEEIVCFLHVLFCLSKPCADL